MFGIITTGNIIFILFFMFFLFLPRLTRKEIIFGVRIPEAFREHDEIKRIKKTYIINYLLIVGLPTIIIIALQLIKTSPVIQAMGIFIPIVLFFITYYSCHKSLKEIKIANKWKEGYQEMSIMDMSYTPEK